MKPCLNAPEDFAAALAATVAERGAVRRAAALLRRKSVRPTISPPRRPTAASPRARPSWPARRPRVAAGCGRSWFSPPDAGLYMSTIVRRASLAPWITLAGGVAVAEGIRAATALPVQIKWPNDIVAVGGAGFRARRKIAGILAEASSGPEGVSHVVLGDRHQPQSGGVSAGAGRSGRRDRDRARARGRRRAGAGAGAGRAAIARSTSCRPPARRRSSRSWLALSPSAYGAPIEWDAGPHGPRPARPRGSPRTARCSRARRPACSESSSGEVRWRSNPTMLLAFDVGNTNVTIGVFDGERLAHSWRLAALRERTADELGIFVTRLFEQMHVPVASVHGIAVASVVPPLTRPIEEMCERYFSQHGAGHRRDQRRHAGALHAGRRRRRRSHRQRRGRVGEVRQRREPCRSSSSTSAPARPST